MKQTILITGAGGFIGYNLTNCLIRLGHNVIGVDLHYPIGTVQDPDSRPRLEVADFRNRERMKTYLSGTDIVIHLASAHLQVNLPVSEYWDVNVYSLRPLLELAQESGVKRFVHVSSVGIYGNLKQLPANEESPCEPQSVYGKTKLAGEQEVLHYCKKNGFPAVIIRPAWVYGPYCPRTLKIYRALRRGRFVMVGAGKNLRHPLFISDMLDALGLAIERETAIGEIFIIAGEEAITTDELVESFCSVLELPKPRLRVPYTVGAAIASGCEILCGLVRKEPPVSRRSLEFFHTNNAFDITKARRTLGFRPSVSFEKGLRDSGEWLLKNS